MLEKSAAHLRSDAPTVGGQALDDHRGAARPITLEADQLLSGTWRTVALSLTVSRQPAVAPLDGGPA